MTVYLHRLGHKVTLAARNANEAAKLLHDHENVDRLPGILLDGLDIISPQQIQNSDVMIVAVPSHAVAEAIKDLHASAPIWISLAKGIILETLKTPCELLEEVLPRETLVLTLSGPSHAGSVAAGLPCTMVVSGNQPNKLAEIQEEFSSAQMRLYTSADRRGAELGGALKNVFAVAAGVCDALKIGDNAKAGLMTRAVAEMVRLGVALGGKPETFYGLTGIGDLIATSYGTWSRNRQLGERVCRGEPAEELIEGGFTAEGYRASMALHKLAQTKGLAAPIVDEVMAILYQHRAPQESISRLMNRPLKAE
jgi:glycerol-3-phosphate dehydrogenase (NAD(P)+)